MTIEKAIVLTDSELVVVLQALSSYIAEEGALLPADDRKKWERNNLEKAFKKLETAHFQKHDPKFVPLTQEYAGFESLCDIERDLSEYLNGHSGLDGEFQGTLKVRIDYEPYTEGR